MDRDPRLLRLGHDRLERERRGVVRAGDLREGLLRFPLQLRVLRLERCVVLFVASDVVRLRRSSARAARRSDRATNDAPAAAGTTRAAEAAAPAERPTSDASPAGRHVQRRARRRWGKADPPLTRLPYFADWGEGRVLRGSHRGGGGGRAEEVTRSAAVRVREESRGCARSGPRSRARVHRRAC